MPLLSFPSILYCFFIPLLLSPGSYSIIFSLHVNLHLGVASGAPDGRQMSKTLLSKSVSVCSQPLKEHPDTRLG